MAGMCHRKVESSSAKAPAAVTEFTTNCDAERVAVGIVKVPTAVPARVAWVAVGGRRLAFRAVIVAVPLTKVPIPNCSSERKGTWAQVRSMLDGDPIIRIAAVVPSRLGKSAAIPYTKN